MRYARQSEKGNVMVVFSADDKYLLSSAVDNEIRQYTCADGRLHTYFDTPRKHSAHNYTRSYYMNNGEYIIGIFSPSFLVYNEYLQWAHAKKISFEFTTLIPGDYLGKLK